MAGAAKLEPIAKALAKGETVPHAQLVTLRDGINEVAAALRQEEKTAEARKLSDVNRLVRRLERAAR